jgi:hypothetical protein
VSTVVVAVAEALYPSRLTEIETGELLGANSLGGLVKVQLHPGALIEIRAMIKLQCN